MISSISSKDIIKAHFKNSNNVVIYKYDPRLLKRFIRDLQDMGYNIKFNISYQDVIFFSKSSINDIKEIDKLMKRNKFEYFVE